jgi:hypothetical protein
VTRGAPTPKWRRGRFGDGPWILHLPGHESGEPCDGCLRDRYTAIARLRHDGRAIAVTITERDTGATFQWAARGDRMTVTGASEKTDEDLARLMWDGRNIVGLARTPSGGPARGTGITPEDLIRAAIERRTEDGWPSEEVVAEEVGRDVRTVRRVGARIPGPGKPYEKVLTAARLRP